jgi:hypothetical protein
MELQAIDVQGHRVPIDTDGLLGNRARDLRDVA